MVGGVPAESHRDFSFSSQLFAEKAARSIAEIQQGVSSTAEITIFLEVLGYNDEVAIRHGFRSLSNLVEYIQNFIDFFDSEVSHETTPVISSESNSAHSNNTQTVSKRLVEAMVIYFPWLTALLLFNVIGFSLWMVQNLTIPISTAFMSGFFLGIIFTEGFAQVFNRLLFSAYEQRNLGEIKRIIRRMYISTGFIVTGLICLIFLVGVALDLIIQLMFITMFSMVSISIQRINYVIFQALQKNRELFISYGITMLVLIFVYFILMINEISNDNGTTYFISLAFAFSVFFGLAIFYLFKTIRSLSAIVQTIQLPSFYKSTIIQHTLNSKFAIQFWENIPYFLFGISYFLLIFGDRMIAWIFNPDIFIMPNGSLLPLAFNSAYHLGVDPSLLFVLAPAMIIQYLMMGRIHSSVHQKMAGLEICEIDQVNKLIRSNYRMAIVLSVLAAIIGSILLNVVGAKIMFSTETSDESLLIMQYASIANIFLSIFTANHAAMIALNKVKIGSLLSVVGAAIVLVGGTLAGASGYSYIVFAYLSASIVVAIWSSVYTITFLQNAAVRFLGRYS